MPKGQASQLQKPDMQIFQTVMIAWIMTQIAKSEENAQNDDDESAVIDQKNKLLPRLRLLSAIGGQWVSRAACQWG